MFNWFKKLFKSKSKTTYIPYAIDRGWLRYAKSVIDGTDGLEHKKYDYEIILEDLISYKQEIKSNEELKRIVIEEIGCVDILICKVEDIIENYSKRKD